MADVSVTINGVIFANPVLPAAGPNVRTGAMMVAAARGGAGGLVSKTVSVRPARDERPTIRRTGNGGLMNSETWSEIPVEEYLDDLARAKRTGLPLVVSIGYGPDEVARLGKLVEREVSPDVFEFSTHYSGRDAGPLVDVARSLREAVHTPIWMKISPNVVDVGALAQAVSPYVDGFVAINSYGPVLDFDPDDPVRLLGSADGTGWLSGPPIRPIALQIVRELAQSQDKPVVGVGGISTGRDAIQFLMVGAHLVQVCSEAIRSGHGVYGRIAGEIDAWLEAHDHESVADIRGAFPAGPPRIGGRDGTGADGETDSARRVVIAVDAELCTGCGSCFRACMHGALQMGDGVAVATPAACIGCGYCLESCRFTALCLEEQTA